MRQTKKRIIWWLVIVTYIIVIYSTLVLVPQWWEAFNSLVGNRGLEMLYILYALIAVIVFLYLVFIKRENTLSRYLWYFLCVGGLVLVMRVVQFPAEKIHVAQYGALGVLLYNALRVDFDRFDWRLYALGGMWCIAVGALDEILQGVLPNRFFDWNDIFVNTVSSVLVLCLIRFSILKEDV